MATKAFFISETYLKDNCPLSGNIDIAELYPHMKAAEDIHIQIAIGTDLYEDLVTKVQADNDLSSYPNELVLVKKIREALMWYICAEALPFIDVKIRNIGLVEQTGENLTTASITKRDHLIKKCKDRGDFYLKLVQTYLCENGDLFPVYQLCSCSSCCGKLNPNTNSPSINMDIAFDQNDRIDTTFLRRYYRD